MPTTSADDQHTSKAHTPGTEVRPGEKVAHASRKASDDERFRLTEIRAYVLWELAGKPEDHHSRERFWHEAEKAINAYCPSGA
jgi:hypothetical protein